MKLEWKSAFCAQELELEWKSVKGFDLYEASPNGQIRNRGTRRILRPRTNPKGYPILTLYRNGKGKVRMVHRIIAETFLGQPKSKKTVNHLNSEKKDNRVDNLDWVPHARNI